MCCFLVQLSLLSACYFFIFLFIFFRSSFFTPKINQHRNITHIYTLKTLITIYPQNIESPLSEQNRPPPKHLSKLVSNTTTFKLNIASYFHNILASPYVYTWNTTGGPIIKIINHVGLPKHH